MILRFLTILYVIIVLLITEPAFGGPYNYESYPNLTLTLEELPLQPAEIFIDEVRSHCLENECSDFSVPPRESINIGISGDVLSGSFATLFQVELPFPDLYLAFSETISYVGNDKNGELQHFEAWCPYSTQPWIHPRSGFPLSGGDSRKCYFTTISLYFDERFGYYASGESALSDDVLTELNDRTEMQCRMYDVPQSEVSGVLSIPPIYPLVFTFTPNGNDRSVEVHASYDEFRNYLERDCPSIDFEVKRNE